jgi:hypothetical protein
MAKSDLSRLLQMRQTELDAVLQDLERAGKIKLTEIKGQARRRIEGKPMIINQQKMPRSLQSSNEGPGPKEGCGNSGRGNKDE